ncbi:hypothetical protein LSAT2_026825 [Lamellibrachia satsuma]|nr:hypothetical protein LSAT2_026825 [Lamellibrachia satsuma]
MCKRAKRTVHQRLCGMNKCKKSRNILGAPSSEYGVEEKLYRIARMGGQGLGEKQNSANARRHFRRLFGRGHETIAYLCQRVLDRVQNYSNVRSAEARFSTKGAMGHSTSIAVASNGCGLHRRKTSKRTSISNDSVTNTNNVTNPVTRLNQQKIEQESTTTMGNEKTNDGQTRRSYNNKAGRGEPSMKKTTSQNTLSVTVLNKKASPRLDDSLDDSPLNRLPDTTALNKLSYRKLAMATPSTAKLRDRENRFVNDAISTNAGRTRYRDIIPRYDAAHDLHCQDYFRRTDVRNLIGVTCTLKPGEKDVKFRR